MPDDVDRASEREQQLRDDALRDHGLRFRLGDANDWQRLSAVHCVAEGCGERISDARRQALPGVKFCMDCQQELERRDKR